MSNGAAPEICVLFSGGNKFLLSPNVSQDATQVITNRHGLAPKVYEAMDAYIWRLKYNIDVPYGANWVKKRRGKTNKPPNDRINCEIAGIFAVVAW